MRVSIVIWEVIAAGLLCIIFMILTLPLIIAGPVSLVLVLLLRYSKEKFSAIIVAVSVTFVFFGLEILLSNIDPDKSLQYYRPHEALLPKTKHKYKDSYQPNQALKDFKIPYGDIAAMTNNRTSRNAIKEARIVDFYTDSLGLRNRHDYRGQNFVLFGDSFAVGNGNTQSDILSEILINKYKIDTYNASFPADIEGYVRKVKLIESKYGDKFRGIMLVFEGNDFPCEASTAINEKKKSPYTYIPGSIKRLDAYRFFFGLIHRAGSVYKEEQITVHKVGQLNLGFYNKYIEVTLRTNACDWQQQVDSLREVAHNIELIVFIPTKYRVYFSLFKDTKNKVLPNVQAEFIADIAGKINIDFIDLTPYMVAAAKEQARDRKYVWWRDDTHWNADGISIAASVIVSRLK